MKPTKKVSRNRKSVRIINPASSKNFSVSQKKYFSKLEIVKAVMGSPEIEAIIGFAKGS